MNREMLERVIANFNYPDLNRFFRVNDNYAEYVESWPHYNDDKFTDFQKLGELRFDGGEKLIITTSLVNKDLTERSGKKDQYEKAKRILKEQEIYDAGFFVFHDESGKFRFSLVYGQAEGTKRAYSNFRRFTYFVSSDQTNKTFLNRVGGCNYSTLDYIRDAFSVEKVTKAFYKEIADWYFWAAKNVTFPEAAEKETNGRKIAVIRMITRLIFIWFMKERRLVSLKLFNKEEISILLKSLKPNGTTYYKAILQNLFFATLNTKIKDRKFRFDQSYQGKNKDYMEHSIYRYDNYFKNQEDMLLIFRDIPFLNGGLFDCLDQRISENGQNIEVRVDGFSDKEVGLNVPNYLFFSDVKEANLNKDYGTKNKKYKVQGLLNILSAYNFTIDENDPNDQEVALDPELLGKVFENLLASFNPETATTARKATGSYYTPREIVDYMVTQSLKQYYKIHLDDVLDIDNKLDKLLSPVTGEQENPFEESDSSRIVRLTDELRIVDPAVGSGAFPMGILNKLVLVLAKVDPDNKLWQETQIKVVEGVPDPVIKKKLMAQITTQFAEKNADYGRKLYLIQKCIYGVDIQQIAIEIAKLRFFISLLVDENIDKSNPDNWGIIPLPNLDFKLMQGNSLISEFMGINLDTEDSNSYGKLMKDQTEELIAQFQDKKGLFQNETDRAKKEALKSEIEKLLTQIFERKLQSQKAEYLAKLKNIEQKHVNVPNIQQRIESIKKDTETLNKNYKFDLAQAEKQLKEFTSGQKVKPFFAWRLYFAEVFHEKGGFDIVIANPPYIKEYINRKAFDGVRDSPYYQGKMDIWYLFACQSIGHLTNDGILTFIAQNNWVTSYGASKLRNKVISDTRILALLDFGDYKIFETSGIQTMVMVFRKDRNTNDYEFDYRRVTHDTVGFEDILALLNRRTNSTNEYLEPTINRSKFSGNTLTFSTSAISNVIRKIESRANFYLDAEREVAQGIVYPQDKLNSKNRSILGGYFEVGDGIFVLSNKEKQGIPFSRNELSMLKPCYTTEELHKWYGDPKNTEWVIYTDSSFKHPSSIKPYPHIKAHLDKFRKVITSDNWPYGLHRAREERFFNGEKIISVRKCKEPAFTYTDFDCYVSATFYVIKVKRINLKYLTAILNSKLVTFWLKSKGKMQGNNYQIDKEPLLAIPIYKPSNQEQQPIIALVDRLLSTIKGGDSSDSPSQKAKVKEYECQIDRMVSDIYDLTPDEIKIVEGSRK